MKAANPSARSLSPARAALTAHLTHMADLQSRIDAQSAKQPDGRRDSDFMRAEEHAHLQQLVSAAVAKRGELVANVLLEEELPRRIRTYQDLVLQVNGAWNDILAFDDIMRRRYPGKASIFNTAGPHERVVVAPSSDRSPLPPLEIDSRRLFAAASRETNRFVEALAHDAEARFGKR